MRGEDRTSGALFSYVNCEARVPSDNPLRVIRTIVDEALELLSPSFERLYSRLGQPSIAPEKLLRALLLQAFYSIRSKHQLMEQLDCNRLFRRLVGLSMDADQPDARGMERSGRANNQDPCPSRRRGASGGPETHPSTRSASRIWPLSKPPSMSAALLLS